MPTIDIYGNGNRLSDGSLKSNNPALTAALDEAYKSWKGSEIMAQGTRDNGYYGRLMPTGQYRISEQDAIKQAFEKAGMDPKLIPERADLAAYKSIGQYNGVGADPLRLLQESSRYEDGRSKDEANTRDFIAKGLANGKSTEEIWKDIHGYNAEHQGGWAKENLGISGEDLAKAALIAAGGYMAMPYLGGASAASGAAAGTAAAGASTATAASGLAGTLGMSAGYGATALNAGALNAGMTLARGGNIGDALKSGATAAVLSPVSGFASKAVGGGITGGLVGGAALGGSKAVLTGKDFASGVRDGVVNAGVGMIGSKIGGFAAKEAKESGLGDGVSKVIGNVASAGTRAAVTGKNITSAIGSNLISQGMDYGGKQANALIDSFNGPVNTSDLEANSFPPGASTSDGYLGTGEEIAAKQGENMGDEDSEDALSDSFWASENSPTYIGNGDPEDSYEPNPFPNTDDPELADGNGMQDYESIGIDIADSSEYQIDPDYQWVGGNYDWGTPDGASKGVTDFIKSIGAGGKSAAGSIASWFGDKANSKIVETFLGGISSVQANSAATDRQKLANQGALDQLDLRQKQKLEDNQRYSASLTGLRPSNMGAGLVAGAMQKLKRTDGTNVFDPNGSILKG